MQPLSIYMTKSLKTVTLPLSIINESGFIMKLWRAANVYWFILFGYICYQIYDYSFETDSLGPYLTWSLIILVLLCAAIMVGEFQYAWYVWLNGFSKKTIIKYQRKQNKKAHRQS